VVDTRQRIVTATTELLRRGGYSATSLKEITAAADAPVGSVYHFFPGGKAELVAAVVVESGAAYRQLFQVIASESADASAAIVNFFDGAAEVLEQTDYIDVCPIGTIAREVASTDDGLRRATDAVFASWTLAIASVLSEGGLAQPDADELAIVILATLEGSFILARSRRDADPVRIAGRQMRLLAERSRSAAPT